MKIQKLVFSAVCVCFAGALSLPVAAAPTDLWNMDQCYLLKNIPVSKSKSDYGYYTGGMFRKKLIDITKSKFRAHYDYEEDKLKNASKCNEGTKKYNIENYYGEIKDKKSYIKMAALQCNGGKDQYFSIGDAIYRRDCSDGDSRNYISFYGRLSGSSSTCFGTVYPVMYKEIVSTSKLEMTKYFYNTGKSYSQDIHGFALGNAMAAIQISESNRDHLIYPINYMLIDMIDGGNNFYLSNGQTTDVTPEKIIGGHCPSVSGDACNYKRGAMNGLHPLAWGGAKTYTGFNYTEDAKTPEGQKLELSVIMNWLYGKNRIMEKNGMCTSSNYKNIPDETFSEVFK